MAASLSNLALFKHVRVFWRVVILVAVFAVPLALQIYFLVVEKNDLIGFARKEMTGVHYLRPVQALLVDLTRTQVSTDAIGRDAAALAGATSSMGDALAIAKPAEDVAKALAAGSHDPAAAIAATVNLLGPLADGSNLSLDPDIDSYYFQDVLTVEVPGLLQHAAEARAVVLDIAAHGSTEERRTALALALAAEQASADGFAASTGKAMTSNASLRADMDRPGKAIADAVSMFMAAAKTADAAATAKAADGLGDAVSGFLPQGDDRLEQLLQTRIDGFRSVVFNRLAIVFALVAAGLLFVYLIARSIVMPITQLTATMKRLAERDLAAPLHGTERRDELGAMARTLQVFKDGMVESDRLRDEQEAMKSRAEAEKRQAMDRLASQLEASVGQVVRVVSAQVSQMESSAQSLSSSAEEATRQTSAVAAASEQASANVQTVASATEELSASIGEISRQVAQSSRIAAGAVSEADRANQMVQSLAEASQKIGAVVALITDIANQTNLLALNATIEAARAGEAGKGFAVVAAEVKNLANQTAKATDEIGGQISGVQSATHEAVQAIQAIGKTIGEINHIAATIASAVEEQSAATKEIARNVEQAATGTQEVSSNIAGVSQVANDTGSAATQVLSSARELAQQSAGLKAAVDQFLTHVHAA